MPMEPAILPPPGVIARPVDFKLKSGWRYDQSTGVFVSEKHTRFEPTELPAGTRIEYKVMGLVPASSRRLSKAEQQLQRYMQMVPPPQFKPETLLASVRRWPFVEEAHLAPEISLPVAVPWRAPR
jgi:hypothetical protein